MQLLSIRTVKAEVELKQQRAVLEIRNRPAKLEIIRKKVPMKISHSPVKMSISSRAMRESIMSLKPLDSLIAEYAEEGIRAAREATAILAEDGNAMADFHISGQLQQIALRRFSPKFDTALTFIPVSRPKISWSDRVLEIEYFPDELEFIWEVQPPEYHYKPYNVEVKMIVPPQVIIEYLDPAKQQPVFVHDRSKDKGSIRKQIDYKI